MPRSVLQLATVEASVTRTSHHPPVQFSATPTSAAATPISAAATPTYATATPTSAAATDTQANSDIMTAADDVAISARDAQHHFQNLGDAHFAAVGKPKGCGTTVRATQTHSGVGSLGQHWEDPSPQLNASHPDTVRVNQAKAHSANSSGGLVAQSGVLAFAESASPDGAHAQAGSSGDETALIGSPGDTACQLASPQDGPGDAWGLLVDSGSQSGSPVGSERAASYSPASTAPCPVTAAVGQQPEHATIVEDSTDVKQTELTQHAHLSEADSAIDGDCTQAWPDQQLQQEDTSSAALASELSGLQPRPGSASQQLRQQLEQSQQQLLQCQLSHKRRISHAFSQCTRAQCSTPALNLQQPRGLHTDSLPTYPELVSQPAQLFQVQSLPPRQLQGNARGSSVNLHQDLQLQHPGPRVQSQHAQHGAAGLNPGLVRDTGRAGPGKVPGSCSHSSYNALEAQQKARCRSGDEPTNCLPDTIACHESRGMFDLDAAYYPAYCPACLDIDGPHSFAHGFSSSFSQCISACLPGCRWQLHHACAKTQSAAGKLYKFLLCMVFVLNIWSVCMQLTLALHVLHKVLCT